MALYFTRPRRDEVRIGRGLTSEVVQTRLDGDTESAEL